MTTRAVYAEPGTGSGSRTKRYFHPSRASRQFSACAKRANVKSCSCTVQENRKMAEEEAVRFSRKQWVGRLLPLHPFRIKAVEEGIKMVHTEEGTQQQTLSRGIEE